MVRRLDPGARAALRGGGVPGVGQRARRGAARRPRDSRPEMRAFVICATLVALLCTTGAAHAESVRVRVFSLHPPRVVEVRFVAPGTIRMDGARRKVPAGERIRVEAAARAVITVVAPRFEMRADGGPWKGFAGAATIRAPSGLYLVAEIPLEEYVAGVVDAEALPGCPPAALHAQAVAARSFAVALAARDGGPHAR
ncbi:MAG: hypothetical protein FJX76_14415, partial [Armatimonadetes bacterium]|nr:hypothetical protein [Armatimonadota bacterium]